MKLGDAMPMSKLSCPNGEHFLKSQDYYRPVPEGKASYEESLKFETVQIGI